MTAKNSNLIYPLTPISFILSPYHMQSLVSVSLLLSLWPNKFKYLVKSNPNVLSVVWNWKAKEKYFFVDDTNQIDHLIWLFQDWSRGEFAGTMTPMDRLWYMICWCVRYLLLWYSGTQYSARCSSSSSPFLSSPASTRSSAATSG